MVEKIKFNIIFKVLKLNYVEFLMESYVEYDIHSPLGELLKYLQKIFGWDFLVSFYIYIFSHSSSFISKEIFFILS